MAQTTTHPLYFLIEKRYPDDNVLITYTRARGERITCTDTGLKYVIRHLDQTVEHRKWLYFAFLIVGDSLEAGQGAKLKEKIINHDLSKFSAVEALGYGYRFGRKDSSQPLKNKTHIALWDAALKHHYESNPHHPEFSKGKNMNELDLVESIVDMLGCRMQRNLAGHAHSTVADIFAVPPVYLNRYTESDKRKVQDLLAWWGADVTSSPHRYSLAKRFLE
jgi:hypothetical protein